MKVKQQEIKKIVVKVGTRLLTYQTGKLNLGVIESWCGTGRLKNQGKDIILVSSGAVGAGIETPGSKSLSLFRKTVVVAVGQSLLIQFYEKLFAE